MEQRIKYIPLALLLAYGAKSLVNGLNWESVALSLVLSGLWYLLEYKSNDKQIQALSVKIEALEKDNKDNEAVMMDVRTSISSLRLTNGLNQTKFGRQG